MCSQSTLHTSLAFLRCIPVKHFCQSLSIKFALLTALFSVTSLLLALFSKPNYLPSLKLPVIWCLIMIIECGHSTSEAFVRL